MIYLEWLKVYELLGQYGYAGPCLDVGGYPNTTMADYNNDSGLGSYALAVEGLHIWSGFADLVDVSHDIEQTAKESPGRYATILSTSTLEHAKQPFEFASSINTLLMEGGVAITSTVFMWPEHGDPGTDYWRFTISALELLMNHAGLNVLSSGSIKISDVRISTWVVASKGEVSAGRSSKEVLIPRLLPTK